MAFFGVDYYNFYRRVEYRIGLVASRVIACLQISVYW
jgi:hypothetical protein